MEDEKCCGSCKHFKNEEINGVGWCEIREKTIRCSNGNGCIVYEQQTEYDDERFIEMMKECDFAPPKQIFIVTKEECDIFFKEWEANFALLTNEATKIE